MITWSMKLELVDPNIDKSEASPVHSKEVTTHHHRQFPARE
jgi:hypothetical protein